MDDFAKGIAKWASESQVEIVEESAQAARDILNSVISLSPIDTGRFLANWHIGPTSQNFSVASTSTYAQKHAEVGSIISDDYFLRNQAVYMVNNVDYAQQVEEIGWMKTEKYAPVAKTLAKFIKN